jgi:hypothetical protein
MKHLFFLSAALLFCFQKSKAQELVVDPITSAAIAVNTGVINGQLNIQRAAGRYRAISDRQQITE